MSLLKFAKGNAKLGKNVHTFSLPSGFTCPGANECLSKADRVTGKIKDGPETVFRCFSASQESLYPNVRAARWYNLDLLRNAKTSERMKSLILASLPRKVDIVRIHVAGDFYSQAYFDAWMGVANDRPGIRFYFYTKNIPLWLARLDTIGRGYSPGILSNFVPTASIGSKYDNLIKQHSLRTARVVYSEQEANDLALEIDHDDSHAMNYGDDFGLLIHGTQPKGTPAAVALYNLRKQGKTGYSRENRKLVPLAQVN